MSKKPTRCQITSATGGQCLLDVGHWKKGLTEHKFNPSTAGAFDGLTQQRGAPDATPPTMIKDHSGGKYIRTIAPPPGCAAGQTDVYAVLEAYKVTCPAVQHALKKLLCAGLRSKASKLTDLREAHDALARAIEMQEARDIEAQAQGG